MLHMKFLSQKVDISFDHKLGSTYNLYKIFIVFVICSFFKKLMYVQVYNFLKITLEKTTRCYKTIFNSWTKIPAANFSQTSRSLIIRFHTLN